MVSRASLGYNLEKLIKGSNSRVMVRILGIILDKLKLECWLCYVILVKSPDHFIITSTLENVDNIAKLKNYIYVYKSSS